MKQKIKAASLTKAFRGVVGAFAVIFIFISGLSYVYYSNLSSTIREESRTYLRELSNRISSDVGRILNDNIAVLHTMAAAIEEKENASLEALIPMLTKQKGYFNYKEIYLVAQDGRAFGLDSSVFINLDDAVRDDVLRGKPSMSPTQVINNQEYILFSVPITNFKINDTEIIALLGCYDPASFNNVLSMTAFNERSYSQIVTQNGTAVTRPTSEYALEGGYNVVSTLKKAQMENGFTVEKLQQEMRADAENQLMFHMGDTQKYLIFTPIELNDWYLFTFVPVEAVNQRTDIFLGATLVVCGMITLAFAGMVAALVYIFFKHKRRLEKLAYVDPVTGGNTMQHFYLATEMSFAKAPEKQFALIYTNIEKFKVMNEQLGRPICDEILCFLNSFFSAQLTENECISRLFADNFCLLIEYSSEQEVAARFKQWYTMAAAHTEEEKFAWSLPTLQMGIYAIQDNKMSHEQMIDRAKLALRDTMWIIDNKLRYGFYDDEVRRGLFREKQLEDRMKASLAGNEFRVYLQPKYHLPEEKIGGAEALVRWETADEGMIYPDEFIPLFEKNGFIVPLDLWVFEEVCRNLRAWIDQGYSPVKISVNCSRAHFKDPDFLHTYSQIANQYGVDKSLLEIELTESIVMENSKKLTQIIASIKAAGFGCAMDDFGSGYSSLNMLQNLSVDTLKLDGIFFSQSDEPERTEALIKSIVWMAKSLQMETVAEGVEQRAQVEMLKRAGCHYIQGYVFARPMEISAFEELAFPEK